MSISSSPAATRLPPASSNLSRCPTPRRSTSCNSWTSSARNGVSAILWMDVPNDFTDPEGTALRGIEAMERFYHAIGMPINIKELIGREVTDDEILEMSRKCSRDFTATCGAFKVLNAADMEAIYRLARG